MFGIVADRLDPVAVIALEGIARRATTVGIRVGVILAIALVVNFVLRRSIARIASRMQSAAAVALPPDDASYSDRVRRVNARTATVSSMLRSITAVSVFTIAVLLILSELDINLGPLLAGAGVAGVAVGFGTQSLVRDVVAGFFVLVEDQYGVGDIIDAGPATGTVERVTLRSTELRDAAGTVWHIPNGTIVRVGNKSQHWAKAIVDVLVLHGTDLGHARELLGTVAAGLEADEEWGGARRVGHSDVQGVQDLGPEGITLRLVVDAEPSSQWAVARELRLRIADVFTTAGIRMGTTPDIAAPTDRETGTST